jgi:hypothetical protein
MNPDERKIEIVHASPCNCEIDGEAIYVRDPCYVIGSRLTKRRLGQLIFRLRRGPHDARSKVEKPLKAE